MRKADKEAFYLHIDAIKNILDTNKVLSCKDVRIVINELIDIKLRTEEKSKRYQTWGE